MNEQYEIMQDTNKIDILEIVDQLLAQRPITLVLMMINSCSYSTNDVVFN